MLSDDNKIKVLVEAHVPYVKGMLEGVARVQYLEPEEFTPSAVRDADALIVRTRTRCDAALLEGSRVTFVGTATIGTDHIDADYCRHAGITVASAPGCNAPAVAQWVMASIAACHRQVCQATPEFTRSTLGVIGVGHVGSIVARWARSLGMNVMLCDPPRARVEGSDAFCQLTDVLEHCDIITLHTPLTRQGVDATYHLVDNRFMEAATRCRLLLNAARGAVCDTGALLAASRRSPSPMLAVDCWEGEPEISRPLLEAATVATPHIAGYSIEGKQRGTAMVLSALASHFGLNVPIEMPAAPATGCERVSWSDIIDSYDPMVDTAALKGAPQCFEQLRNNYRLRHEVTVNKVTM